MANEKKMIKTAVFMSGAVILSKIFGMLRDMLLASNYGTGNEAVAFETASRLPILIFDFVLGGVISAAFIPVFNELLVKKGKKEAQTFANKYINLILIITGAVAALGIAFSDTLVRFLAPELSSETLALASSLSKILFPMIIFTGLAFSFVGILQSFGEFNIPAIISLVSNGIMVLYYFTFNKTFGIYGLCLAMLCGWGMQAVIQIPKLCSFGYKYRPTLAFSDPYILQAIRAALPILVGTWTQPICSVINTRFASGLNDGRAVTAYGYANRLYIIIVGVFSFVATNLLFPYLSKAHASGEKEESKRLMISSIKILLWIVAPITAGIFVLSDPVISVVFGRGQFTASDVALTATALKYLSLGMVFMAVNEVLTKAFFARKNQKVPMISSVFAMAVNFVLVVLFAKKLGILAISLASCAAVAVNCLVNYYMLKREDKKLFAKGDVLDIFKCIVCSALMGAAVYFASMLLPEMNKYFSLFVLFLLGVLVYAVLCLVLRVEEMKFVTAFLKGKKND